MKKKAKNKLKCVSQEKKECCGEVLRRDTDPEMPLCNKHWVHLLFGRPIKMQATIRASEDWRMMFGTAE